MKLRLLVVTLIALVAAAVISAPQTRAQGAPTPTAGTKLVGGLLSPRGMKIGPDGMIYVAEAGTGGDIAAGTGDSASKSGLTGRISKVDPTTGTRTTVADKLPSNAGSEGDSVGPADVAFIGSQLYYVQTHAGTAYGFPATTPTGVYKVNSNGTVTLVADIGAFNIANPVNDIKPGGVQHDIETGGNPYSMTVRDGAFYVVDGNQNQIMKITTAGVITRLNEFPGHPVTTGITYSGTGPFYVAALGQFPFAPADGKIYKVSNPSGAVSTVASGFSSLTDAEYGPGGNLYALQFGDQASDPNGPPWVIGSGKILKVDVATGKLTPLVNGFTFTTSLIFSGDTAYVANGGITIPGLVDGAIWKITGFSAIAPITLAPTPAPTTAPVAVATATPKGSTGVIAAPNTGTGGASGGSNDGWLKTMLALSAVGAVAVFAATRMIWKRDE
ncbi:MAG: ScyD/ScyE family protein [Chloroflexota bacterium]|nr:ScyD/ScyE family protein [Chloroflexota bacterium]